MNVVEPILFQTRLNPLALAICVPGSKIESVTYGMLGGFIDNAMRSAIKAGISPGNLVATYIDDAILHIVWTLGLLRLGAVTLSLRSPKGVAGIKPDIILTDRIGQVSQEGTVLGVDLSWLEGSASPPGPSAHQVKPEDTCRIVLTSGSTGSAKGIAFSHQMLTGRISHYTY